MCRFLTDLFSTDVHVLIPLFILAAKTCVFQFSACLDWPAPCVPGIKSHFPGWHLKAEPTQPGCRGQRSWLIGCYPLALIYTLSTTCTGFLKVSLFIPLRPAHLWVFGQWSLLCSSLGIFFFLVSTHPHLLWSSRPLFTNCTDWFTWLFSNCQPCISENEAGLHREFQLEKGLLKGFKRVCLFWINIISVVSLVTYKNLICLFKQMLYFVRTQSILNGLSGLTGVENPCCGL